MHHLIPITDNIALFSRAEWVTPRISDSLHNITNAKASQKTKETGKVLPISEGNHWEYKHEIKNVGSSNSPDYQPYQSSRIEVYSVELKEKLASFTYYGLGDRRGYFDGKKKYNIKNKTIHVEPLPNVKIIFETGRNFGNYSYTVNWIPDGLSKFDKVNVNVSYQQQQVSVPAGDFKGLDTTLNIM